MNRPRHELAKLSCGEPTVDQGVEGKFKLSWNPDDDRFYVEDPISGVAKATFKRFSNAVYFARINS